MLADDLHSFPATKTMRKIKESQPPAGTLSRFARLTARSRRSERYPRTAAVCRRCTGGELLQLPDFCGDLDPLGRALRGREGCSGFNRLCPGGKGKPSQHQ